MAISLNENIIVGLSDVWSRKIRSFVTIFGIILGVMSIIVVLALMNGINQQTLAWMMERGGLSKITIHRDWSFENPKNVKNYFTLKEIQQIQSLTPEAKYFNPQISQRAKLSYGKNYFYTRLSGVLPDFSPIEEWETESGRFISDFDINQSNDVIVIGTQIRDELFGNKNPLGKFITVNNRRLQVIGVMQYRYLKASGNPMRDNQLDYLNRRAFIPISTMIHKGTGEDMINDFSVKAQDADSAPDLARKLEAIILNMRQGQPVFTIQSAKEEADAMQENAARFKLIFFLISTISLLVGGIVIMNIMLATIQERTREIGIRLAVGARRRDIFVQFLVQSVLVTSIGGVLGIAIGISILNIVSKYISFLLIAGTGMIFIALAVSAGVGILFGIFPAIRASKLDPVEALRYE